MQLENFVFVYREVEIEKKILGEFRITKTHQICVQDISSKILYPHPISNFINEKYRLNGKSQSSLSVPSGLICRFLNYLIKQLLVNHIDFMELKQKGLRGLTLSHSCMFLNYEMSKKLLDKKTFNQYKLYLAELYFYLKKMNLIDEAIEKYLDSSSINSKVSIFKHPSLSLENPNREMEHYKVVKHKTKDFGINRIKLAVLFIKTARDYEPDIAFGICLQIFGGLRRGEVVNLSRADIKSSERQSMSVEIHDRRNEFFQRLSSTRTENPKRLNYLSSKLCRQTVLDNDLLWDTYNNHLKYLNKRIKNNSCLNPSALFLDRDGNPMSGQIYERKFNKAIMKFLEILKENDFKELEDFEGTILGTHIGRGVYTNILIDLGFGDKPMQLAIARGDRNTDSAFSYIDSRQTELKLSEGINQLRNQKTDENDLGKISEFVIKKWKREMGKIG